MPIKTYAEVTCDGCGVVAKIETQPQAEHPDPWSVSFVAAVPEGWLHILATDFAKKVKTKMSKLVCNACWPVFIARHGGG